MMSQVWHLVRIILKFLTMQLEDGGLRGDLMGHTKDGLVHPNCTQSLIQQCEMKQRMFIADIPPSTYQ